MDYRKDGIDHTESFDDIGQLLKRKRELEGLGAEIKRVYYKDDNKVTPHQGLREIHRRLAQEARKRGEEIGLGPAQPNASRKVPLKRESA